jgi:Mrp family chromosome partitioning ATPase
MTKTPSSQAASRSRTLFRRASKGDREKRLTPERAQGKAGGDWTERVRGALTNDARRDIGAVVASREMIRLGAALDAELTLAGLETCAVVMVAGAARGEGCTVTALGLALTASAADDSRRVLLIDADDGSAQSALGVAADQRGYAELMAEGSNLPLEDCTSPTAVANLHVLPRGREGRNRRSLSGPLERLLGEARRQFDLVIIDAPALLDDPAALVLAHGAGNVLLVVRQAGLSSADLAAAVDEVRRADAQILGSVLTRRRNGRERRARV